jgi:hypothetical protein
MPEKINDKQFIDTTKNKRHCPYLMNDNTNTLIARVLFKK